MKTQCLNISLVLVIGLLSIGSIFAQDGGMMKKDAMDMEAMKKSPHHLVMMAYHHNLLTFSKALRDMSKDGMFEDVELARNSLAEIKRSMEKMDEVHQLHMNMMKPEMITMMKPMQEKMQAENILVNEHIAALEKALAVATPNATDVHKHAAELVIQLEKMNIPDKKKKGMNAKKMKV